jgi:hypothetical protein
MQNSNKITGLFVWNVSDKDVRFSMVQYSVEENTNVALKVTSMVKSYYNYNKHFRVNNKIDLYNIDLYKKENRFRKLVGMDILFDTYNRFADIRHNRISLPILGTDIRRTGFRVDNVRNFLFLRFSAFSIRDVDDWETDINFSCCFIMSELSLIDQIPNV